MHDRYSLRFESGERKGEIISLPPGRFTIGRRSDCSLSIAESSVSGRHAEIDVGEGAGVRVRDLGSTNGTTVAGRRVEKEASAAHGDRIGIGSVALTLIDRELADVAPSAGPAASPAPAERIGTVRAEQVARAGRRSRAGILFLVAGLLALGGVGWRLFGGGGGGGGLRPVAAPAGNLLGAGYSFEDDDPSWTSDEAGPATFLPRAEARASGGTGMRAELDAAQWARLRSTEVAAHPGQTFTLTAELRARGGAGARVGIEFLRAAEGSEGPGPLHAWNAWSSGDEEFRSLSLAAPAPPGTASARAVVEARTGAGGGGSVDVDDVALVAASGAAVPNTERGDYQSFLLGDPPQTAAIYKLGRPLLGDLEVGPAAPGDGPPRSVTLKSEQGEGRSRVLFDGVEGAASLSFRVEPQALAGGIATMGPGGYREHGAEFERAEATGILFGTGIDVAALRFEVPVAIQSSAAGASAIIRVELGALESFVGQLDFSAERARAGDLAHQARNAERDGKLGPCLAAWRELLEEYPFEKELVAEAEAARARLIQQGHEALQAVRVRVERANFFRLVDLYRRCHAAALEVAERFAGSEVEADARALVDEVQSSLAALETDLDRTEVERLNAILGVLEASEAPGLAAEVREVLSAEFGGGK